MIGHPTRLHQNTTAVRQTAPFSGTGRPGAGTVMAAAPATRETPALAASGNPTASHDAARDGAAGSRFDTRREATPSGDVCRLLSLLADRTRLKILRILAGGERPVLALTSQLSLPQPTVSHHLAALRIMGLVSPRRQGKHVFYALGPRVDTDGTGNMTFRADNALVTVAPHSVE